MSRISPPRIQWLSMLAKLTSPMEAGAAAQAFAAYAPMLERFPDAAFTPASLEHVASQYRRGGIPTYGDVREHLGAWWKENRPIGNALPLPAPQPEPRREATQAEHDAVRASAARAIAAIRAVKDYEYGFNDSRALPPKAHHLTRTQLNAAYARDRLKGPQVPE